MIFQRHAYLGELVTGFCKQSLEGMNCRRMPYQESREQWMVNDLPNGQCEVPRLVLRYPVKIG